MAIARCFKGEWSAQQNDTLLSFTRKQTAALLNSRHLVAGAVLKDGGASVASEPSSASAPSLEEVTLINNTPSDFFNPGVQRGSDVWSCKLMQFSSGVIQVRATQFGTTSIPRREKSSDSLLTITVQDHSVARFESSIKRSQRTIRERCLELDADHLLTLTKRGKFTSCDDLWTVFNRFNVYMSRLMGDKWKYVAVPELHADGVTWHMHCAIKGFIWAPLVRRIWQKALGGTGHESGEQTLGNVDLRAFRRTRAGAASIRRIASYIAKYVGKGIGARNRGRRLFAASRCLSRVKTSRFWCHDIRSIPELAVSLQQWLCSAGADAIADTFHWSRHRQDESLLMRGFVLTTFVTQR